MVLGERGKAWLEEKNMEEKRIGRESGDVKAGGREDVEGELRRGSREEGGDDVERTKTGRRE